MIKIIWTLIGINTIALLIFLGAYFVLNNGKHVDYQEKGWTFILSALGLIIILLAAVPLRYFHSTGAIIFSGVFAALPLAIVVGTFISKKVTELKHKKTFAATYYTDKTQRSIAAAIENNDTILLKQLIKGQDLNIQGKKVFDQDGLNYLQFAIHLRSNPLSFPFNDEANTAAIRILIENGIAATPALAEATRCLSPEKLLMFLNAGADPNCSGTISYESLLFQVISSNDKKQNDIAILLIQKGADVNAKNYDKYTPVMYAAYRAGTTDTWSDTWRLVRYMLEDAHADYNYTLKDGASLNSIIQRIKAEATDKKITMPQDFEIVVNWLQQHHAEPVTLSQKIKAV